MTEAADQPEPTPLLDGATIGGQPASERAALAEAAALLGRSRNPVIAGLGTDVAGARAAIELGRRIGACIDHMHAASVLRDLDVMRQAGWIVTTPLQLRARADFVVRVGPGLHGRLSVGGPPTLAPGQARRVIRLFPGDATLESGAETIAGDPDELPQILACIRALVAGRAVSLEPARLAPLRRCAEAMAAARFGVAVWSSEHLDALAIEMLCGLIDDLNKTTRFAGLPLDAADNLAGVMQVAGWQTGLPIRTRLGPDTAEHDPWRFDTARMIASGEADAALWISALTATPPPWSRAVPTVALVSPRTRFSQPPAVAVSVGRPGVDHDAVLFNAAIGTLAFTPASAPRASTRVADALDRIAGSLTAAAAAC
jgi:formylmethanofuran dehydrogenase subunit B